MPKDKPPLRLCRDIGPAAVRLHRTRGTGRRFRAYSALLKDLCRIAYPPRVAIVGAGEGVEVVAALRGLRGAARGPSGMDKCLYTLAREKDMPMVERAQRQYSIKGRVVNQPWPAPDAVDRLAARGDFWFSLIAVAPTTDTAWTLDALRSLAALCTTGTTLILCRAQDAPMRNLAAALAERGWGGVTVQELALLQRHGGPPSTPRHAGMEE